MRNRKNTPTKSRKGTALKSRFNRLLGLVVLLTVIGSLAYQKHRKKRDFELQCAFYYCFLRIEQLHQEGKGADMEYYYQVAKDFEQRISDREGMEDTSKQLEAIYWKYKR